MDRIKQSKIDYKKKMRIARIVAFMEIILTACISLSVILSGYFSVQESALQVTQEVDKEYETLVNGYVKTFQTMLIPIEHKIQENPSFDEMSDWLQGMEGEFQDAFGGPEIYDGIAFTYKGGYARSWKYGDYSNYDPSKRPWYQQAQAADGKVAIVAPYVTFLDQSYLSDDGYILMSIAQKYNDEISFDLDLKIKEIKHLLTNRQMPYDGEKIFFFDQQGYILTSTDENDFAHNINQKDDVISKDMVSVLEKVKDKRKSLIVKKMDGQLSFMYIREDNNQNAICVLVPFWEVFLHEFINILMITFVMILIELFMYYRNKNHYKEYMWRDMRLSQVADSTYAERLYVDLKNLQFSGNEMASQHSKDNSYENLFALLQSRLVSDDDIEALESFLGVDVVENWQEETFTMISKRFLMKMQDSKTKELRNRTIEISKMKFQCDGRPMMCIAMRDAAESVDLLKKALADTEQLKEEKEEEYNRFMSYICMAEDGVEELDVEQHTITRYYLKDQQLEKQTVAYPGMPFTLFHEEDREKAYELYNEEQLRIMCENVQSSYWECRMKWYNSQDYHWCNVIVLGIPISKKNPFKVLVLIKPESVKLTD